LVIRGAFKKTFINIFMKKYAGFVYETTNVITGMKYIGSYIGLDTDICFGNSRSIEKDIKKYGIENFSRSILEYVKSINVLAEAESAWLKSVNAKSNPMYFNRSNKSSQREVCGACNTNLVAVNYVTANRTYYRKLCSSCIRKGKKIKLSAPAWFKAGYRKRDKCENCGFKGKHLEQLRVFYIDGDKENNNAYNLRTICLNCQVDAVKSKTRWLPAEIIADF
jgi:hypothetical protein